MMPVLGHCRNVTLKNNVRRGFHLLICDKKHSLFVVLILSCLTVISQDSIVSNTSVHKNRVWLVTGVHVVGYGASLAMLSNVWYKDYAHSSFHTFNDSKEWLQVDKFGHGWTAYNTARISGGMWRWAGLSQNKAAIIGGAS